MTEEELLLYTIELARRAKEADFEEYAKKFTKKISARENVLKEYLTYLNTGKLLCEYSVSGYTIADIIIWQMDHFKALLDDYLSQNKGNEFRMVLAGFDTMMDMEDNPEKYIALMQETTGTDFLSKY